MPSLRDKRLFIFDLDGTLVDAYGAIHRSFNFTMKRLGYPCQPRPVVTRAVGHGDVNLIRPFVKPKDLPQAVRLYRTHHRKALKRWTRWMPHARRLLSSLKKEGRLVAIASNRPTRFTREIVRDVLAVGHLFDMVLCADVLPTRKPHPLILRVILRKLGVSKDEAVFVGDMALDILTGKRAGITTVALPTGSSPAAELRKAAPDLWARDLKDFMRRYLRVGRPARTRP
jgi:HAD superfamily hydrolase (TIGR01662 family)